MPRPMYVDSSAEINFSSVRICGSSETSTGIGRVKGPESTLLPPGRRQTSTLVSLSVTVIFEPGFCLKPLIDSFSIASATSGTMMSTVHCKTWITVFLNSETATNMVRDVEEFQNFRSLQQSQFDIGGAARFPQEFRLFSKLRNCLHLLPRPYSSRFTPVF